MSATKPFLALGTFLTGITLVIFISVYILAKIFSSSPELYLPISVGLFLLLGLIFTVYFLFPGIFDPYSPPRVLKALLKVMPAGTKIEAAGALIIQPEFYKLFILSAIPGPAVGILFPAYYVASTAQTLLVYAVAPFMKPVLARTIPYQDVANLEISKANFLATNVIFTMRDGQKIAFQSARGDNAHLLSVIARQLGQKFAPPSPTLVTNKLVKLAVIWVIVVTVGLLVIGSDYSNTIKNIAFSLLWIMAAVFFGYVGIFDKSYNQPKWLIRPVMIFFAILFLYAAIRASYFSS